MKSRLLLVLGCMVLLLNGCSTVGPPPGNVMEVTSSGTVARQFDCQSRNPDGSCNVNQCKAGPGGLEYDCASFAYYCVRAGHHWTGTKELGKCTRVL